MSGRFPYLQHDGVLAFSHRGGTSEWPENTMPAFQYSIDLGYRYLETDVHLSADGVLYAFHDSNLSRTTGEAAHIGELESHEIEQLLVYGRAHIPRLEDLFQTWPEARINIDPKSDAAVLPLIDLVDRRGVLDRVCIGSFSDRRIALCRARLGPELCTSMGRREALRLAMTGWGLSDPRGLEAGCAQLPTRRGRLRFDTPRLLQVAHEHDIDVHFWTIDDPAEMHSLLDLGADGIMTDEPRLLREILVERCQWAVTPPVGARI